MKRFATGLLALAMTLTLVTPAMAVENDYAMEILVDGAHTATVERGSSVTVTLTMSQTDADTFDLYSMQDYVCFDPDYFTYVDDSIEVYTIGESVPVPIFSASAIHFPSGAPDLNRVYINRVSGQAQSLPSDVTVVTFELQAIENGTTTIFHDKTEVFQYPGNLYDCALSDAVVTISDTLGGDGSDGDGSTGGSDGDDSTSGSTGDGSDGDDSAGGSTGGGATHPSAEDDNNSDNRDDTTSDDEDVEIDESDVPLAESPFVDVSRSDWFAEAVDYVVEAGLMNGTSATAFSPNAPMNRAMLVTILYRLENMPAVTQSNPFLDVAQGTWYTDAVIWASANGIVEGYGNGSFGPMNPVTREQAAAILNRYVAYKGGDVSSRVLLDGYIDAASVSGWAQEAMQWAVADKLISGTDTNALMPAGNTTRAQAAQIFMRLCENVLK